MVNQPDVDCETHKGKILNGIKFLQTVKSTVTVTVLQTVTVKWFCYRNGMYIFALKYTLKLLIKILIKCVTHAILTVIMIKLKEENIK